MLSFLFESLHVFGTGMGAVTAAAKFGSEIFFLVFVRISNYNMRNKLCIKPGNVPILLVPFNIIITD